jgi:G:T-mismatch repair DNA endonuclease (very short patch repair protein)
MEEFGIKRRSATEHGKLSEVKRRETLTDKTGFPHNFCKGGEIRNRVEKDLKKQGVTNWFQLESVKLKSRQTLLKKYGTECPWKTDTIRGHRSYSKLHKQIVEICHELNIDIKIEFKLKKDKESRYYAYDIILTDSMKLIEVNGDYWHGNPKLYKSSDILLKGSSREMTVEERHKFDKKKNKFAVSKGYSILIIWEKDIKDDIERIKKTIIDYSSTQQISPSISSSVLR